MSEISALVPIEQKTVIFYDDQITAVLVTEDSRQTVYIPIKPICDHLGVTWPSQNNRIHRDPVLSKKAKGVFITNSTLAESTLLTKK